MNYLDIALIVLALVGIWAVIEVALTVRGARTSIDEVASTANEVIAQTQPIVAKLDGMVDELQPAVKDVPALMEKANTALDSANESLASVNAILDDVASVSGTAAGVTEAVNGAVSGAASAVAGVVGKIAGGRKSCAPAQISEGAAPASLEGVTVPEPAERPARTVSYVDYDAVAPAADSAEKPESDPDGAASAADAE